MTAGKIATFYSYKGGVGRTFVLANMGVILARWGYKVLCVDWDIEAPGLDEYFRPHAAESSGMGLLSLLKDQPDISNWRSYCTAINIPQAEKRLYALFAGKCQGAYTVEAEQLDWSRLYADAGLGNYLESLRDVWKIEFDFVLIDSRTGITDAGGICTVQMPDLLFIVFVANTQSLAGAVDVAHRVRRVRASFPRDRSGLPVIPVASRFDSKDEVKLSQQWMQRFVEVLSPLYSDWLDESVTPARVLESTRVPYSTYYSFGENLPVLEESPTDPEGITYKLSCLAALLAHDLGDTDKLSLAPEAYVSASRKQVRPKYKIDKDFEYEIYLSYEAAGSRDAEAVAKLLKELEIRVFHDAGQVKLAREFKINMEDALSKAKHFVLLETSPVGSAARMSYLEMLVFAITARNNVQKILLVAGDPSIAGNAASMAQAMANAIPRGSRSIIEQLQTLIPSDSNPETIAFGIVDRLGLAAE